MPKRGSNQKRWRWEDFGFGPKSPYRKWLIEKGWTPSKFAEYRNDHGFRTRMFHHYQQEKGLRSYDTPADKKSAQSKLSEYATAGTEAESSVPPFDIGDLSGLGGAGGGGGGPTFSPSIRTKISEEDLMTNVKEAYQSQYGRDPNDAELMAMIGAFRRAEMSSFQEGYGAEKAQFDGSTALMTVNDLANPQAFTEQRITHDVEAMGYSTARYGLNLIQLLRGG